MWTTGETEFWSHGGFFPKGLNGPLTALQIVTYAFLGIELIGITAGEARDPRRELPSAINRTIWRISLFYVGAVLVILMLIPWNQVSLEQSPFVVAWAGIGIGAAAGVLNGVVITSALSSCNSGIFASGRMLHSLAHGGDAPASLTSVNRNRVPARALTVSGAVLVVGVAINALAPGRAFEYITSVATVAILWVWAMIVVSHLRRRRRRRAGDPPSAFAMPGSPWTNYLVLAYIALVAILLAVTPGQRVAVIAGGIWTALLAAGWLYLRRSGSARGLTLPEPLDTCLFHIDPNRH